MDYTIIIYAIIGVLPSLIWLFYYLTKDLHPEPKKMIIKVFLWGCFITIPVFFVQMGFTSLLDITAGQMGLPAIACSTPDSCPTPYLNHLLGLSLAETSSLTLSLIIVYWFLIIAFSEELFKYFVVKAKVVNSPHLDEPLDIMLYMVVAALGFTAIENILYSFAPMGQMSFDQVVNRTLIVALVRFIGATFLHTLCSGVIGYSMAISFCEVKRKGLILFMGFFIAVGLHGLYDFSIMILRGDLKYIVPAIIILTLAFLVFSGFEKLKSMKSICKIK